MGIVISKPEEANRRLLFCNNLRDIIRHGPIGVAELSKITGFSTVTIYNYYYGTTFPPEDRIQILADALGVTVNDLFDDTNAPWKFAENMKD